MRGFSSCCPPSLITSCSHTVCFSVFPFFVRSRTFPFSTFGWLLLLLSLSSSSSSSLLFSALQTLTRKLPLQHQQQQQHTATRCTSVSKAHNPTTNHVSRMCVLFVYTYVAMVVLHTYCSVCKFLVWKLFHILHTKYTYNTHFVRSHVLVCGGFIPFRLVFFVIVVVVAVYVRLHFPQFPSLVLYILIFLIPIFF